MSDRHVLFVESNSTGTGALALERLLAAGHRVTFLARQPQRYAFLDRQPDAAGSLAVETVETNDGAALLARARELHKRRPLAAVLTFSEYYIPAVADLAATLGLRYLDPAVARRCRDKAATRRALAAAGLPTPELRVVGSPAEARRAAREVAYPCVVKPPSESSSTGVRRVEGPTELIAWFERLHALRTNARGQSLTGDVLVESLLEGPEYSVETLTREGGRCDVVGIVAKHLSDPPRFVETGHDFPAGLDGSQAAELRGAVLAALDAVGYDFGPAHTEVRLTPAGPVVVEINPRLAGGMIPELIAHAAGIDLLGAVLDQLLGGPAALDPTCREHASIRFLLAPDAGRLIAVDGLDEVRRMPGVRLADLNLPPGRMVKPAEDALDRLGQVIVSGPDPVAVRTTLALALGRLRVLVEPVAARTA